MQLHDLFPLRAYLGLALLGVGFGLAGAMGGAAIASNVTGVHATAPVLDIATTSEPLALPSKVRVNAEAADAPSDQVGFVIGAGTDSWLVLPVDTTAVEAHRIGGLTNDDGVQQVVEPLRARDLTPELRAWRDVRVSVDGTCTETLHDFALITQVTGDASYLDDSEGGALDEVGQRMWTVKSVKAEGRRYVAAKLAHCHGTYARAASAPMVPFTAVENGSHLAQAEQQLRGSDTAKDVREALAKDMPETKFDEVAHAQSLEMTDPRTGTNWVAVHISAELACGGPNVNFYGLYRVDGDQLVATSEIKTDELSTIDALVDLDGDGVPEILGSGWLSPTHAFYSAEMETLATYEIPFIGCPC